METVTKEEHPGRVASSKKLVEWNRKNKVNLLKEPAQEPIQEPTQKPAQEPAQEPRVTSSQALYACGVIIIAGAAASYFLHKPPEVKTTSPPKKDIFFNAITYNKWRRNSKKISALA